MENVIMEVSPELNTVLLDEIVHVISSNVVSILILNVFEEIVVVRSLLVPDTDMYPVGLYELTSGVNVAVYIAPLFTVVIVPNVPPLIIIIDSSNFVVAGIIENVIVAVSPISNSVFVDSIVHVTAVTRVSIVIDLVFEVNVVEPLVPDIDIAPATFEFVLGVNVEVYLVPDVAAKLVSVPPVQFTNDKSNNVVDVSKLNITTAVCPIIRL
jgi:hypothetical protein